MIRPSIMLSAPPRKQKFAPPPAFPHPRRGGALDAPPCPPSPVGTSIARPPTRADVRQTGRRGRRPLRSKPTFPRRDEHCSSADPGAGRTNGRPMVVPTAKREPHRGGYQPPADVGKCPTSGPPGASAPTEQTDVSLPPCHCEPVRTLAWQSVSFVSVGEGLAPPADPRRCPKNGRGQAPPLRSRPTSPVSLRTCQGTHKFYGSFVAKNL